METTKYELTPEHRAQLKPWAERWIANAMSTKPMDDMDRRAMRRAINGLYAAAKLPPPKHIVFVPSPFVLCYAAGFAAAIWYRRAATSAATIDATSDATSAATLAATRAATIAATIDATIDATSDATSAATIAATRDATLAATIAATRDATRDATIAATIAATRDATIDATSDATIDATLAATRAATIEATLEATLEATAEVAIEKWYTTIPTATLLALSRSIVGKENARAALKCCSAIAGWNTWDGGNQWSYWVSYLSFFRHVAKLKLDYSKWSHYELACEHGGPRVMHPDFCMVSDRPEVLLVDAQNRPHCDTGPFCRWRDGSALYAVHGVRVPAWVIEQPQYITVSDIEAETNTEIRRVLIERYGQWRYLLDSGAKKVHSDDYGTLYRREVPGDEPLVMVKVVNSTPESDGSFKDYFIRVPPTMKTAREAVAWTFDRAEHDYAPLVET